MPDLVAAGDEEILDEGAGAHAGDGLGLVGPAQLRRLDAPQPDRRFQADKIDRVAVAGEREAADLGRERAALFGRRWLALRKSRDRGKSEEGGEENGARDFHGSMFRRDLVARETGIRQPKGGRQRTMNETNNAPADRAMTAEEAIRRMNALSTGAPNTTIIVPGSERVMVGDIAVPLPIHMERDRQIRAEGYSRDHDDGHVDGELLAVAVAYRTHATKPGRLKTEARTIRGPRWAWWHKAETVVVPEGWPWGAKHWKPKTPARDLERAGALCLAEIDRLRRANPKRTVRLVERELRRIIEAYNALGPA